MTAGKITKTKSRKKLQPESGNAGKNKKQTDKLRKQAEETFAGKGRKTKKNPAGDMEKPIRKLEARQIEKSRDELERKVLERTKKLRDEIARHKLTQEALKESESRYRIVADNTHDWEFWMSPGGKFIYTSPACKRITGYDAAEFLKDEGLFSRIVYSDDLSRFGKHLKKVKSEKSPGEMEFRILHSDGTVRWIGHVCQPVFDDGMRFLGIRGSNRDITRRKQSEEALRESESKYRSLFANMINGFAYHRIVLDENGEPADYVFLEINDAFEKVTGLKRESIVGSRVTQVIPGIKNDPAGWIDIYGKVALTGEAVKFDNYSAALGRWYTVSAYSPARGYFATVFDDITERKRAEEALRESQEDLNRAQAVARTGSWRLNVQRNELLWSEENWRIFGVHRGTPLTYDTFLSFVHPDDREYVDRKWMAALRGEHYDIEHRIIVDGGIKWVHEQAVLEFDKQGMLLGGFGTTQDITERKQMQQALEMAYDELEIKVRQRTAELTKAYELLEKMFANIHILAAYMDRDFNFIRVNKAYADAYGRDPEFYVGKNHFALFPNEENEAVFRKVVETGETYIVYEKPFTYAGHPERGVTYWDWSLMPVKDADGTVDGIILSLLNVTEQKRAQDALLDYSLYTRNLIEANLDPLVTISVDGKITDVNQATEVVTGFSRNDLIGSNFSDYFTEPERAEEVYRKVFRDGLVRDYPLVIRHVSGKVIDVLYNASVYRNKAGEVQGVFAAARDVTESKEAEDALRAERLRLFSVMEHLPAYVCLLKPDYTFAYVNQEFRNLFGDPGNKRCYEYLFDLQNPCDKCETFRIFTEHLASHQWEWTGPDGKTYAVYDYPFTDIDGSPLVLELGMDISRRKAAEDALRKSSEEFEDLYNNAPCGYHSLDKNGMFVRINDTELRWLGYSRDEIIGKKKFSDIITAESLKTFEKNFRIFKARGSVLDLEFKMIRKDGTILPVLLSSTAVKDRDGTFLMSRSNVYDITERKEAENRDHLITHLLELFAKKTSRKEYLDSVVRLLHDWTGCGNAGIRVVNENRQIPYDTYIGFTPEFMDKENLLSLDSDACACIRVVTGKLEPQDASAVTPGGSFVLNNSFQFLDKLTDKERLRFRGNCIRSGYASIAVVPIRYLERPLGAIHLTDKREGMLPLNSIQFIESMVAPLIGEAINKFSAEEELAIYRDHLEILVKERTAQLHTANEELGKEIEIRRNIERELRQSTEELKRSNTDLQQFAYAASHDLQEPLRVVAGFVKLLEKRYKSKLDEKADEFIQHSVDGVKRMQTLIKDLLAFSQVGTKGKAFKPVNCSVVLEEALSNLRAAIEEAGVEITYDLLPTVMADSSHLGRLFQNLIGNAIKFRGSEPLKIHIAAQQKGNDWVFSVQDNGIGMDTRHSERIFVIFQRLHTREEYEGTGIGLAICKKIVERHGGRIWVESESGKGSTFYFTIPVMK